MSELHHSHGLLFSSFWWLPSLSVIAVLAYLFLRQRGKTTRSEQIFFFAGLLSFFSVATTPIGHFATTYFWCHMIQHMVLMMVTGPLLVMGTVNIYRPDNSIWKFFTGPTSSWLLYAALMIGIHFTGLHRIVMDQPVIHYLIEVPAYVLFSYLFYYNILDRKNPHRRITPAVSVLMLFFMMVPETLTGFFIYAAPASLYDGMFSLNDQRLGGALMWSGSMILDAVWLVIAVSDWLKDEERKSRIVDEDIQRG